jgi:hypothetical protein
MKLIFRKSAFLQEVLIVVLYIFLLYNYIGKKDLVIIADGKGYYDYLPAMFIYKDLNFNYIDTLVTDFYNHKTYNVGINPEINGKKIDKYFIGTSLVEMPFFLVAHQIALNQSEYAADGYSLIYQKFVFYSALFYLFLGLFFLRKLLRLKKVPILWIAVLQFTVLFASSLMHYASAEASFSHVYSFAFVAAFAYFITLYSQSGKSRDLYLAALVFGIIVLIRPANGLVFVFIPFLYENLKSLSDDVKRLFTKDLFQLTIALSIALIIVAIQPIIWYIETGFFFLKSYSNETFDFTEFHLHDFLFSYRKGFFVYAPVFLVLIALGSYGFLVKKNFWKTITFLLAFIIVTYVLSSWWVWFYGGSYGARVMIDYYSLIIVFASSAFTLKSNRFKIIISLAILSFSYISIIQTYQYQSFILDWGEMNKEKFWKVFLKTEDKYRGLVWLKTYDLSVKEVRFSKDYPKAMLKSTVNKGYSTIDTIFFQAETSKEFKGENALVRFDIVTSFQEGSDEIIVVVDNPDGSNRYYSSQVLIRGPGKENFSGTTTLYYEFKKEKLDDGLLKIFYIKNEDDSKILDIELRIFDF